MQKLNFSTYSEGFSEFDSVKVNDKTIHFFEFFKAWYGLRSARVFRTCFREKSRRKEKGHGAQQFCKVTIPCHNIIRDMAETFVQKRGATVFCH